jgi:hypothetical protein
MNAEAVIQDSAYVNVVACASDRDQIIELIKKATEYYKLEIIDIDEVLPYLEWRGKMPHHALDNIAIEAFDSNSLRFSTFHTY